MRRVTSRCGSIRSVASAMEPGPEELQEIGRRLCALAGLIPEEPVCAETLQHALHSPACCEKKNVVLALRMVADALAAHELPPELRLLRQRVDAYADWLEHGNELRVQLAAAIIEAQPMLDEEADTRADARANAFTDEERAQGLVAVLWPSPESVRHFPREVLDVLGREVYAVTWLQKVMHDLPRLDADHRIFARLTPIKTGITKTLAAGGYRLPEITTVLEPRAKSGPKRKQARNTVRRRLESKSKDMLYVRAHSSGPAVAAENEETARSLAGLGTDVRVVFGGPSKNARKPDE